MEGYIRKFVQEIRMFQKEIYPKRYFIIDFNTAKVKIFKTKKQSDQQ